MNVDGVETVPELWYGVIRHPSPQDRAFDAHRQFARPDDPVAPPTEYDRKGGARLGVAEEAVSKVRTHLYAVLRLVD
jgi:hypothetical protein